MFVQQTNRFFFVSPFDSLFHTNCLTETQSHYRLNEFPVRVHIFQYLNFQSTFFLLTYQQKRVRQEERKKKYQKSKWGKPNVHWMEFSTFEKRHIQFDLLSLDYCLRFVRDTESCQYLSIYVFFPIAMTVFLSTR